MSDQPLKAGDTIRYEGYHRAIGFIDDQAHLARTFTLDGRELVVDINGGSCHERICPSKFDLFIALNANKAEQLTKPIGEDEINMARQTRRAPRGGLAAEATAINKQRYQRNGRAAETRRLARETSKTVDEIHAEIKPKFVNADKTTTRRIAESERNKK